MSRFYVLPFLALSALLVTSCFTPQASGPRVTRINPDAQVDISGNWNDTDANLVSKTMIRDCLSRPWAAQFKGKAGKDPVVKLYPIKNRSEEHIKTKYFTKQVEMELVNSGTVQVVAASDETGAARAERRDQGRHASDLTKKENQNETGSDFVLNGWIISQDDKAVVGGQERAVRAYVVTMELINVETQRKVWMKVHRLKKVVSRAASAW
ncbi:MAG: penicillin-binding protein activator LpoB [Deltaproteobacteria bacterium]|nr:penicillin-binding protein activator LpoB [Deltaproteobacteria bacterium]